MPFINMNEVDLTQAKKCEIELSPKMKSEKEATI